MSKTFTWDSDSCDPLADIQAAREHWEAKADREFRGGQHLTLTVEGVLGLIDCYPLLSHATDSAKRAFAESVVLGLAERPRLPNAPAPPASDIDPGRTFTL